MAGGPQRRLSDLRKTRKVVKFEGADDDGDFEIEVWVVKLNDTDQQACLKAADAAKARMMIDRGNHNSEQWQATYGTVLEFGDDPDTLIEFLSHFHIADKAEVIQAEVAGDENGEWAKEGYLEGLVAAWRGVDGEEDLGLQLAWQARNDEPADLDPALAALIPEAERVYAELERYEAAVEVRLNTERERFCRDHEGEALENLRALVVEKHLDERANDVWMKVFQRSRIYYSTRELADYKSRYFTNPAEVDDTDAEFRDRLAAAYREISTEGVAGKGSQGPQSSSPQSGSSGEEEISLRSGPTDAND